VFRGPPVPPVERPRRESRRGETLLVLHAEGEEVEVRFGRGVARRGGEEDGGSARDGDGARCLAGDLAGLEDQGVRVVGVA